MRSEVAAALLLALDRLEQGLEVPLAKSLGTVSLRQLEEYGRPVLHRLGEDLQQVNILVPVGEDPQLPELRKRHPGIAHPLAEGVVVAVRRQLPADARQLLRHPRREG